ncbi:MAG: NAD(P)-binding protein [Rhabdochlamydiaceae bacterium]
MKPLCYLFIFLSICQSVFSHHYNCIFVGSSPIVLLEACYQSLIGKKVLVVEKSSRLGGAWQTIDVCGLKEVDTGCHHLFNSQEVKHFLDRYVGCEMVPIGDPLGLWNKASPYGYYPKKGCQEMINKIEAIMERHHVERRLNTSVKNVIFNAEDKIVDVELDDGTSLIGEKIFFTHTAAFNILNLNKKREILISNFYHLYVLFEDERPCSFTYREYPKLHQNVIRIMNLTPFSQISHPKQQIVVFQIKVNNGVQEAEDYLQNLKNFKLLSPSAKILNSEIRAFSQASFFSAYDLHQLDPCCYNLFEIISTQTIPHMQYYIKKWETRFPLFQVSYQDQK